MKTVHEASDIAGIFDEQSQAAEAVRALLREHFGACHQLSVIASNRHERQEVQIQERFPTFRLALTGAALGAVLTGLVIAISGIGFGPFTLTAWGPLWAVFESAYVGGSVGFALGALMSIEQAHPELDFDAVKIRDGVVWVGLRAAGERALRARQILEEAGARHMMEREPEVADSHHFRSEAA